MGACPPIDRRRARYALFSVCLGVLMIVVDSTAIVVALPPIKSEFDFSEMGMGWVINAFMIPFAGFRLLSGRLGDTFGHRRVFLLALILFAAASLGCGLAKVNGLFVAARAVQGIAGAAIVTSALALIMAIFPQGTERARAFAIYNFASFGGGAVGLLIGGALTEELGWRSIFLVNLPLGIAAYGLCAVSLPRDQRPDVRQPLDIAGVTTVTAGLTLVVVALTGSSETPGSAAGNGALFMIAAVLLLLFLAIEARAAAPVLPLGILRKYNLIAFSCAQALFSGAVAAQLFVSLYLQLVLGYGALRAGLAFLPLNLIIAAFSLGLSARIVVRFGVERPLVIGLLLVAAGLALLGHSPTGGTVAADVIPGLGLLGIGTGLVISPVLIGAVRGLRKEESGLASGLIGTFSCMGRAVGWAMLASTAADHTTRLLVAGVATPVALNEGYHLAFTIGSGAAAGTAVLMFAFHRMFRSESNVAEQTA